jgi:hypothetical protein
MALIFTISAFAALVLASVFFVVRTALKARITEDGDIPDPLDDYVRAARATVAETKESFGNAWHRQADILLQERRG